jgi:gas vesicle protein GvpN
MNRQDTYVKVHPEFRAIFTSNPEEYAGVHKAQYALADRLVTMDLDYYDRDTEIAITATRSHLEPAEAAKIVDVVRDFRASEQYDMAPTLRACIMIARVTAMQNLSPAAGDARFVQTCLDVLESKVVLTPSGRKQRAAEHELLGKLIRKHCG